MSDTKITRDVYEQYANKIVSVLDNEAFYEQFKKRVDSGASSFKLGKKRLIQDISIDWIDTIEDVLPNLDTIVRNPRRFIVQEEDIVDISLARSISTESVKYLAQHTNMISKVDEDGMVTPSKILNITKEESFEIYENRFIYTLLLKLKDFVTMRYDKIKKASATQDVLELDIESRFNLPSKKVTMRTEYYAQLSFDEVMRLDPDTLTKIERVAKIDRIITDFLSSGFAKSMRNSAPVRPPIMRTNVILKEPNFKKALTLWQFIETYNATAGFSTSDEVEEYPIEQQGVDNLRSMITLNTMLFESLYEQHETDMDMEDKQFGDFLRVGEMDFQKDELNRDEYAQKLEDQIENDREQENIEEVKPQEEEEAEHEMPPEQQPQQPEQQPQEKEKETVVDKEVVQEVEVERPVEVERFKEMPPKADQEEVDLEPDAEKFDQHLFDVRKLYKRPDDDKLKQEDIAKVRDAIDRCLTSYRRIKQEEIEERERQEQIRRRREDMQKRAAAFEKQRIDLENAYDGSMTEEMHFGMDPLSFQKAKLAEQKRAEEKKALQEALRRESDIDLDDKNIEGINKQIDEMEAQKAAEEAPKPKKRKSKKAAEQPAEAPAAEQPAESIEQSQDDKLPKRKGIRYAEGENLDPWAAPKPKKAKNIEAVDEDKVQVGGIRFKDGTTVDDPYNLTNRAEKRPEESEEAPAEAPVAEQPAKKPRKPRTKKQPVAQQPEQTEEKPIEDENKADEAPAVEEPAEVTPVEQKAEETLAEQPENEAEKPVENEGQTAEQSGENAEVEEPKSDESAEPPTEQPAPADEEVAEQPAEKPTEDEQKADDAPAEQSDASAEKSAEQSEAEIEKSAEPEQEPKKPAKKRKKGELSATTLNQKYSAPSGKKKNLTAVDESKVGVGGLRFKDGTSIDDPFTMLNLAHVNEDDSDDNE